MLFDPLKSNQKSAAVANLKQKYFKMAHVDLTRLNLQANFWR